ncbi:hypothetical protein GCM10027614_22880 [Micromonospora vulcania]
MVHDVPGGQVVAGGRRAGPRRPRRHGPGTLAEATGLAARLKGHPLALRGAGTYLAEANRIPVGTTRSSIRTYDDYREALDRRTGTGTRRNGSSGFDRAVRPVVQSWEMSLDLLAGRGLDQARPVLRLLACLGDAPIPYAVLLDPVRLSASPLVGEIGEDRLQDVLRSLADFALVDLGTIESLPAQSSVAYVVTLHPLVRELIRDLPDVVAGRAAYHELVLDLLDALRLRDPDRPREEEFDPDEPDKWASWHVLAPPTMGAVLDFLDSGDLPRPGPTCWTWRSTWPGSSPATSWPSACPGRRRSSWISAWPDAVASASTWTTGRH